MRAGRAVEFSVVPLLSVVRKENLGEPHAIFAGGERYVSPRFAEEAERVLQQELRDAGLGERSDYLEFIDLMAVVQQATLEYYGWVTAVGEAYAVLAASVGRDAALVVRRGERVLVERVEIEKMIERLVYRLPDVPVGRGDGFSVSNTDFSAPKNRLAGSLMRRSASARPELARRLDALIDAQRLAVTKLYAAKRDARGARTRADQWVTVLDLVEGRWALTVTTQRGEKWINAAPGTDQVLAARLTALAGAVR